MATAEELYNLQKTDTLWAKVKRRLNQIQAQLGETEEIKTLRRRIEETEAGLHHWHGQQKDAELLSQSLKIRITETETELMGGRVTVPKDLENLQLSLEALQRHRAGVEDKAVEALEKVEEANALLAQQRSELAKIETDWRAGQVDLVDEETKMKRNYLILRRQRETMEGSLDAASLEEYERLRKRKGGVAVAPLENGSCGACHVQLPTGVISNVQATSSAQSSRNSRVFCPSCGRILYSG